MSFWLKKRVRCGWGEMEVLVEATLSAVKSAEVAFSRCDPIFLHAFWAIAWRLNLLSISMAF